MVKMFNSLREEGVKYEDALRIVGEKYYLSPERIKNLIPRKKKGLIDYLKKSDVMVSPWMQLDIIPATKGATDE